MIGIWGNFPGLSITWREIREILMANLFETLVYEKVRSICSHASWLYQSSRERLWKSRLHIFVTPLNLHNHFHVFFTDLQEVNQRLIIHLDSLYSIHTGFIIVQNVGNRSNLPSGTNSKVGNKIVRLPKSVCRVMRSHLRLRYRNTVLKLFLSVFECVRQYSPSLPQGTSSSKICIDVVQYKMIWDDEWKVTPP